jgi:hypothetical protein
VRREDEPKEIIAANLCKFVYTQSGYKYIKGKMFIVEYKNKKLTPLPLVRERILLTELPPIFSEIYCQLLWIEVCRVVSAADPLRSLIFSFLDQSR